MSSLRGFDASSNQVALGLGGGQLQGRPMFRIALTSDQADTLGGFAAIAVILSAFGAAWRVIRRGIAESTLERAQLAELIEQKTEPIQPHANGGSSLPDVVKMLSQVISGQIDIRTEQAAQKADLRQIKAEQARVREVLDQKEDT